MSICMNGWSSSCSKLLSVLFSQLSTRTCVCTEQCFTAVLVFASRGCRHPPARSGGQMFLLLWPGFQCLAACLPDTPKSLSHIMTDLLPCRLKAAAQQTAGVGQNGTVYIYGVRGQAVLASLYRWTSMYSTYFFMAFAILSAGPLSHCATLPFLALNKSQG